MTQAAVNPFENYDLKAEAEEARDPSIRFAFEYPRLLARFRSIDVQAMAAKNASRRSGYLSVGLVLLALLIASAAPVLHGLSHKAHVIIGYTSAGLGLLGTVIGLMGMRKQSARRVWLRARLQTEVMRLFHFHYIAARLPELARVKGDPQRQADYLARRDRAFESIEAGVLADPERELDRIAKGGEATSYDIETPEAHPNGEEDPQAIFGVLTVWRKLRLDWQLGYCEAKLAHHATGKRMSSRQTEDVFATIAWVCVAGVIGLHVLAVLFETLHIPRVWLEVAVVWIALTALAVRALEDGLQPQREVERYEQFRASIMVAKERLAAASDLPTQLEIMRSFERIGLEEMRVFMRTHAKSRFLL